MYDTLLRVNGLSFGLIHALSMGKSRSSVVMIELTIFSCSYSVGVVVMSASVAMCMRNQTTLRLMFPLFSAARRCSSWFASWISIRSASYSAHTVVDVTLFVVKGWDFFLIVMGTVVHPLSVVVMVVLVLLSGLLWALFAIEA